MRLIGNRDRKDTRGKDGLTLNNKSRWTPGVMDCRIDDPKSTEISRRNPKENDAGNGIIQGKSNDGLVGTEGYQ